MAKYVARRILSAILVIWGASTAVFFLLRLSGDPAALLIDPNASREDREAILHFYELDKPQHIQYIRFLERSLRGDLGDSFAYGKPALSLILERVPATIEITLTAIFLAIVIGVPLGVISAIHRNSFIDHITSIFSILGQAIPNFWLGIMLILLFAVQLKLLPTSGRGDLSHLILPTFTLAYRPAAKYLRLTRVEFIRVLGQDYIRTARSKGLSERAILIIHAFKNASIGLVILIGMDIGFLLGGAIITETVFSWPGIGRLVVEAVSLRDYPVVQADIMFISFSIVFINLFFDLLSTYIDPRIRLENG